MNKTVVIAGKDSSSGAPYAAAALDAGRNVLITVSPTAEVSENDDNVKKRAVESPWHRHSPISARSLIVHSENVFGRVDEAVVVFDATEYAEKFSSLEAASFTKAVDEMILGYGYLCGELIRSYIRQKAGTLVFVLRELSPASGVNIPVAAACAAFSGLADSIARSGEGTQVYKTVLVRAEENTDEEISAWLFGFIDTLPAKPSLRWYKTGTKNTGVFSLFR